MGVTAQNRPHLVVVRSVTRRRVELLTIKMKPRWFLLILTVAYQLRVVHLIFGTYPPPKIEEEHFPDRFTTAGTTFINGTDVEIPWTGYTPDYRVEEPMFLKNSYYIEEERPFRLSPHFKQNKENSYEPKRMYELGCYCCTTYRKFTLLAGCATITTRHVLTTANPTVLILRSYGDRLNLEGILGGWYDTDVNTFNSSLYFTPCRIHYHPLYRNDHEVNVSHPVPVMYDLSVWAATYPFYGFFTTLSTAVICPRAASGWFEYASSIPRIDDFVIVVGFQFMKAYRRNPTPFHKYGVRTRAYVQPCPKTEWQWFHCVMGEYWGRLGFDSGGGFHLFAEKSRRIDGMAGICSFSMKLRAFQLTHYFTVVDSYPVLDFLYDAFLGLTPNVYLDDRFENSRWYAPVPWYESYIPNDYIFGEDMYYKNLVYYRR